jgi:hypothetical protein
MRALGCIVVVALAPGCWPDFPDSRFHLDASVYGDGAVDVGVVDGSGGDAARDKGPSIEGPGPADLRPDFSGTCTPGQFIACAGAKSLEKCNATGDGLVTVSCIPFECNPVHGYCNECNIGQPPKCVKDALETCSAEGLLKTTPCGPLGCKAGECCTDTDGDTYLSCADDCNDNDKLVNPAQTGFFPTASDNSFDYNCDTVEEQEFPSVASCAKGGGGCTGAGWTATVPACGQSGSFADCVDQGGSCVQQAPTTKVQRCR